LRISSFSDSKAVEGLQAFPLIEVVAGFGIVFAVGRTGLVKEFSKELLQIVSTDQIKGSKVVIESMRAKSKISLAVTCYEVQRDEKQ
jgi:hypothetical protein